MDALLAAALVQRFQSQQSIGRDGTRALLVILTSGQDFSDRDGVEAFTRSLGVVFALLALAACNSSPTAPGGPAPIREATIVLQFGSSTQVNTDLRVSFAQVLEDSRCPASVVCVWQGNGAIRLDITTGRDTQPATLNTAGGATFPRDTTVGGYTFTLVELDPERQTSDSIPAQQYRATIRVSSAQ
jgi:hypothetical protein